MATKVRVSEYVNGQYGHYEMQILGKSKYNQSLFAYDVIGSITWQSTVGEEREHDKWYGMQYNVQCDFHHEENLGKMAAIAKKLRDTVVHKQPDEVLAILEAEKHMRHCGQFIPETYAGQNLYRVMKGEEHYSNVVAPNEVVARKLAKKHYKLEDVVYDHVVTVR